MKQRPIIFSSEMVKAILEGHKTQTRRVIKPQPILFEGREWRWAGAGWSASMNFVPILPGHSIESRCPYGKPGDLLWVRERFRELIDLGVGTNSSSNYYEYKADRKPDSIDFNPDVKWKPSIHMPHEASRIFLAVVEVRVEKLQEISDEDCIAEGILSGDDWSELDDHRLNKVVFLTARSAYEALWNEINAKRGFSWKDNPWVWVIEFKMLEVSDEA